MKRHICKGESMKINKNITTVNFKKAHKRKIEFVVLHYTAGKSDYDGAAYDNTRYFKDTYRGASAHYFVDCSDTIWQCVEDEHIAWHVGDNNLKSHLAPYNRICTNSNSIGVEMVSGYKNGVYFISEKTFKNASELCAHLLKKYSIGADKLICHFDVTHKLCPMPFISGNKKNELWEKFVRDVEDRMEENINEVFKDIKGHWAEKYIEKLYDYGIVSGDGMGSYRPNDPVTRAEAAKMLSNALLILGK